MRQALGLRNGPAGPQVPQRREAEQRGRRFVKDGEVPVVVVHSSRDPGIEGAPPVNRIAAAESLARSERTAREQAERALAEAQATIQHLRTQLVHAEMAYREGLATERRARELAETALREATESRATAAPRPAEPGFVPRRRGRPPKYPRPPLPEAHDLEAAPSDLEAAPADLDTEAADLDTEAADLDAVVAQHAEPPRRRGRPRKHPLPVAQEVEAEPVQWWLPSFRAGRKR